ncbi:MAG: hypothetical protein ACLFQV_07440 [Vulcanimicrobiota bacterium]
MGFFDAIKDGAKKLSNRVTGNYGQIILNTSVSELLPGTPLPYNIEVKATGELKAKKVYLKLKGIETCQVTVEYQDSNLAKRIRNHSEKNTTREIVQQIEGALEMQEGKTRVFEGALEIPKQIQPSYDGVRAKHTWKLEAVLEVDWGKDLKSSTELFIR